MRRVHWVCPGNRSISVTTAYMDRLRDRPADINRKGEAEFQCRRPSVSPQLRPHGDVWGSNSILSPTRARHDPMQCAVRVEKRNLDQPSSGVPCDRFRTLPGRGRSRWSTRSCERSDSVSQRRPESGQSAAVCRRSTLTAAPNVMKCTTSPTWVQAVPIPTTAFAPSRRASSRRRCIASLRQSARRRV
jgi:hypothetical protein